MRLPLPGNVTSELVRVALMEARPAGLRLPQLVAATDLSARQVHSGLVFIREFAAAEHQTR